MGTVYLGRMRAARGVSLTVAIKRINRALAGDPHVMGMFVDEARITRSSGTRTSSRRSTSSKRGRAAPRHGVRARRVARAPAAAARARGERLPLPRRGAHRVGRAPRAARRARDDETSRASRSRSCTATSRRRTSSSASTASRASPTSASRARRTGSRRRRIGEVKGKLAVHRARAVRARGGRPARRHLRRRPLLWEMIAGSAMRRASSPGGLTVGDSHAASGAAVRASCPESRRRSTTSS